MYTNRPTAEEVELHPFFWPDHKKLLFLKDASDRLEIEKPTAPIVTRYEKDEAGPKILQGRDWTKVLDKELVEDLGKYRKYNGATVRDLLRVIRNKSHHYRDLAPQVRKLLGTMPEGFLRYFLVKFPHLFIVTYAFIKRECAREPAFQSYFAGQESRDILTL